jgi:hypothetical protein
VCFLNLAAGLIDVNIGLIYALKYFEFDAYLSVAMDYLNFSKLAFNETSHIRDLCSKITAIDVLF